LEQTVRREVLEETGWAIDPPKLLGVKHFRHLTPKPAGYSCPYPDAPSSKRAGLLAATLWEVPSA
jgi:8-oxo-dGTP pyrophosphatase MutT (NUDIX family)